MNADDSSLNRLTSATAPLILGIIAWIPLIGLFLTTTSAERNSGYSFRAAILVCSALGLRCSFRASRLHLLPHPREARFAHSVCALAARVSPQLRIFPVHCSLADHRLSARPCSRTPTPMTNRNAYPALQGNLPPRHCCNPRLPRAGSLSWNNLTQFLQEELAAAEAYYKANTPE